ncbi:helicase ARIP4-like isoform X2 [Tribolium madens]|uniref:helicase ARIP4-like isoform X2 n=1 Tax=Tribolium madens TaxID=41895 RepID=UPI001CF728DE|nr:helicase ARIP4-like isoform X2 [Tribolium madens]
MEPILQRFGDVTIQRLEKPKVGPPADDKNKDESSSGPEDESNDETMSLKRSFPDSQISIKKFKFDPSSVTLEKKHVEEASSDVKKPSDDEKLNFSDSEISDFDSESELESDSELLPSDKNSTPKVPSEDEFSTTSFLDKLVDDASETEVSKPPDNPPTDSEDYDFDIKEKLKEMGEISFQTVKKGEIKPKKVELSTENEVVVTPARKPGVSEDDLSAERKGLNLRRNIREVMDETKLDESTLAAQRQEMERLQRVQEQQRLLRDLQRQAAQERMQNKVISLLQGNNFSKPGTSSTTRIGNTVLVKLPNGQTKPMTRLPKRPFDLVRVQKSPTSAGISTPPKSLISMKKPGTNLTPSVSIAPVTKKIIPPVTHVDSESEEDVKSPPKLKTKEPVTTIDISSDEDCIVVSEPEGEHEESEDDPSNSGMHTNDEFNQPDEQGRVVVNIGHPENEPDLFLAPQIARVIKPHQIGGVRFLYDNVIESTGRFESSTGFGCILAHSMGLGKTLQVVCFSDIFLRHTPAKTILCIMPINTLQNWMAEFNMWLPTEEAVATSPLTVHGEVRPRKFNLHVLNDSHKTLAARHKVIKAWKAGGGVLLIGYEQFRLLSLRKHPKSRRKPLVAEPADDGSNKPLFDEIHEALVKPGPDLVICDEGHRIKNSHASISQALKQMRTKRRVVLTGYPLQNNLMEYWCMVDFVRPNYLGSKTEFCNMFERPIMNGQCIDSTEADIKLMRYRAHVLHSLLVGFVQRRSHAVLQTTLPQKEEYVLLVRMLPFQRKLYETFMNEVVRSQAVPNPLKAFAVCCKIWNHPDVLYNFLKKRARGDAVDIDLEEVASTTGVPTKAKKPPTRPRKSAAKGKPGAKPAASITPYNATENPTQQMTNDQNFQRNNFFEQGNSTQFQNSNSFEGSSSTSGYNSFGQEPSSNFMNTQNSFVNNISDNSQFGPNYNRNDTNQNFNYDQNSYQNYSQQSNYWGQNDNYAQYNSNFSNNSTNQSWVRKDEKVMSENSNESKPKINIISDIKLPSVFNSPEKKIKILSDIKIEPKVEDLDDKSEIKPEIKKMIKDELKNELNSTEENPAETSIAPKLAPKDLKEDSGIPYDWAIELLKDYIPGRIENSAKMEILFCIIRESIALGDRLLVFSQSLITLDLIEQFLQMNVVPGDTQKWCRNTNYYRLDGSTSALEREKLINEFNSNPKIHVFLVSTRAGSLGINLIGANRVVVLDASWNPCHDTQAVCRVYRYGQRKPCFVYRLVVDNCLEKKIYDRQINKQGMSDRVVDECNPDAHLTMKDVSTLCWDDKKDEGEEKEWLHVKDNYIDVVLQKVIENHGRRLNKEPFQHESLLVDRKEKQLSQQEKRLAKKGYEREKLAARQPAYNFLAGGRGQRPVASVRPMQQGIDRPSRWIPAEHWQRQGMTAQEMTLPLDVVIPTNQPEKGNIVLKAGQKVLVLKSPKGVYMQLENGKIVAIKTAIKVKGKAEDNQDPTKNMKPTTPIPRISVMPQKRVVKPFTPGIAKMNVRSIRQSVPNLVSRIQSFTKKEPGFRNRTPLGRSETDRKQLTRSKDVEPFPGSSSDEEHVQNEIGKQNMPVPDDIQKRISLLKKQVSIKRLTQPQTPDQKHTSALQRLEQTTTAVMNDNTPFQETLDSITSSYKDDALEDDASSDPKPSDTSDHSDEVTYVSEQPPPQPYQQSPNAQEVKTEAPTDYYNNYYNYNMQPYHAPPPPPPQGYGYPAQPPPYDLMGYPSQPQQPQYNYGYQGYPPPQPHYPPPPPQPGVYDYNAPQPQPVYGGYNPYPQQYPPPPPPPQEFVFEGVKKLENSVLKLYLVNCVVNNKTDKVMEFFLKMTPELQNQSEWKDWFVFPYIKNHEENPAFTLYFTKQWQDTLLVSLHNFLASIFQYMPTPTLMHFEEDTIKINKLEQRNESLRNRLALLIDKGSEANVTPCSVEPPPHLLDDFYIIAQENNIVDSQAKSLKSLIRNMGTGSSPVLGRKESSGGKKRLNSTSKTPKSSHFYDV